MNADKIFFVQDVGDGQFETESIWCKPQGEFYEIDNIPFIAKNVSLGDVVSVEYDEKDGVMYFQDFIAFSGNTTVRIYVYDASIIESTVKAIQQLGGETELFLKRSMIAVNVPKAVLYHPIKLYLDAGEKDHSWTYEESCFCHQYNKE